MLYDFMCWDCRVKVEDVEQAANDEHKIDCPKCGKRIGQFYHAPEFHCNRSVSDYYDPGLGMYVPSKQFREDAMKAQGLTPYEVRPKMKKAREEAKYIRKHAGGKHVDESIAVTAAVAKDEKRERIRESLSSVRAEIVQNASKFGLTP